MLALRSRIERALSEITHHLQDGIIPFWLRNGIDHEYGGFLTCFDENGIPTGDTDKYIVAQTRMIWGMAALHGHYPHGEALLRQARQGFDFLTKHFWDPKHGGWYWRVTRDGRLLDGGKVVYGQSFAIYALSEYAMATGDARGLEYAKRTFDLLQDRCADRAHGGYYENLEEDWRLSDSGFAAGDRKTLDVHMHLMEAFSALFECSGEGVHKEALEDVVEIIVDKMIDKGSGCGMNQFDVCFRPLPPINIRRTWNAERAKGETMDASLASTSYGHNVELAWLLRRADTILGRPAEYHSEVMQRLVDHSLAYGLDSEFGGVYRDGPYEGPALVRDKEWWQNCEVLVGYLDAFERTGDERYFDAFCTTWDFDRKYMINWEIGEWRQLLNRHGSILMGDLGNPWKALYHTGRAMLECKLRLERLLD